MIQLVSDHRAEPPTALELKPLDRRYLPGRGLIGSVMVHAVVLGGLLLLSLSSRAAIAAHSREQVAYIDLKEPDEKMYLPILIDSSPTARPAKPPEAAPPKPKGFSYPGLQPIVSDFQAPTNRIQTLLQPAIVNAPILQPPLTLPNIVQMPADAAPAKLAAPVIEKLSESPIKPAPRLTVNAPLVAAPPPLPPPAVLQIPGATSGAPILALSPMPAPAQETIRIPAGEARGQFAISPEPNLIAVNTAPTASSGAGGGNNKSAFPGITILGGPSSNVGNGSNIISIGPPPPPLQTSYGITVLSSETTGGGGLPSFGVFANEPIYTVFLDMRRNTADATPSWTFEYAVLKSASQNSNRISQGLVLPFPLTREQPVLAAEFVARYPRSRIIVSGVINAEGKMAQFKVQDSPDVLMNGPVLAALNKWTFKPAQLDGENVAVKVLIGIPLSVAK